MLSVARAGSGTMWSPVVRTLPENLSRRKPKPRLLYLVEQLGPGINTEEALRQGFELVNAGNGVEGLLLVLGWRFSKLVLTQA